MTTTQAAAPSPTIACPSCDKHYRWRPEFAGKELACKCGAAFRPTAPPGAAVATPAPKAAPLKHPYAMEGVGKSAVERALEAREDEAQPSRLRDLVVPVIVLPVGACVAFGIWMGLTGPPAHGFYAYGAAAAAEAFVFLPAAVLALVLVASWMDVAFGRLSTVLLKAGALTLGPAAIADALTVAILVGTDFDWSSVIAAFGMYAVLLIPLTMYLFEVAIYEAALWTLMVFLPRIAAGYMAVPPLQHVFD